MWRKSALWVRRGAAGLLGAGLCCCWLAGCAAAPGADDSMEVVGGSTRREAVVSDELQFVWPADDAVFATLRTSRGDVRLVLYPRLAPLAVENFCTLAEMGYYDSTEFHRVVRGFVIQGGDATGLGAGGHTIWGNVFDSEPSDQLHHYSGALCAAPIGGQSGAHNSQFYIVATAQDNVSEATAANLRNSGMRAEVAEAYRQAGGAPYLDYTDTVFGQVVGGMDVVDTIAALPVEDGGNRPKNAVLIEGVTLENWPPPEYRREAPRDPDQLPLDQAAGPDEDLLDGEEGSDAG
jgi:peptidyl-prolyl cis-trans isomerase B (cyclophilin B)